MNSSASHPELYRGASLKRPLLALIDLMDGTKYTRASLAKKLNISTISAYRILRLLESTVPGVISERLRGSTVFSWSNQNNQKGKFTCIWWRFAVKKTKRGVRDLNGKQTNQRTPPNCWHAWRFEEEVIEHYGFFIIQKCEKCGERRSQRL